MATLKYSTLGSTLSFQEPFMCGIEEYPLVRKKGYILSLYNRVSVGNIRSAFSSIYFVSYISVHPDISTEPGTSKMLNAYQGINI